MDLALNNPRRLKYHLKKKPNHETSQSIQTGLSMKKKKKKKIQHLVMGETVQDVNWQYPFLYLNTPNQQFNWLYKAQPQSTSFHLMIILTRKI